MTGEALGEDILVALRKIIRAVDLNSRVLVQKFGITGPQLVVLRKLARHNQMTIGSLAEDISLSNATVTGIVDRLERRELVRKDRDTVDRRRVFVHLTEKGRQLLESTPPVLQEQFLEQLGALDTWEQNLILSSLQRISFMMAAEDLPAEGLLVSGSALATTAEVKEFLEAHSENETRDED